MKETGGEIICVALATLAVKGLMMMMMVWTCLPFIRSGQNHLARHNERGTKRWEDNIREWTGLEFAKS